MMRADLNTSDLAGNVSRRLLNDSADDLDLEDSSSGIDDGLTFVCCVYGIICACGILGNGFVVYVVARYSKMRTVPNMYLFNLAVSDICYLVLLPFLIVTALKRMWIFGWLLCKLFYIFTSLNWFASVFTLIVMSADRYMAVCHPVSSIRYRTPGVSFVVCFSVWLVSTLFVLPICLFATTDESQPGVESCTIEWPKNEAIAFDKAFIGYAMLFGFALPMVFISVFYVLVVLRLKSCGPHRRPGDHRRRAPGTTTIHRRVTKMVFAVVTVHIICWLPHWIFQLKFTYFSSQIEDWHRLAFQFATVLSYANSVFNPLLYAFLGDTFRSTFIRSISCCTSDIRFGSSLRMSEYSAAHARSMRNNHGAAAAAAVGGVPDTTAPVPPNSLLFSTLPGIELEREPSSVSMPELGQNANDLLNILDLDMISSDSRQLCDVIEGQHIYTMSVVGKRTKFDIHESPF